MAQARQEVFADTGNRVFALLLDLILVGFVAGSLSGTVLSGAPAFLSLVFLYFAGMPLSPLQGTLGKWICRIKLCDRLGRRLAWRSSMLRAGAMLCWFGLPALIGSNALSNALGNIALTLVWLLFLLPWASIGFLPRRESLFDLLAGSLVVRYRSEAQTIFDAEPAQKPGILNVGGAVFLCLSCGAIFSVAATTQLDRDRRARIGYALTQVAPVRQKIEAFHEREQRWPAAHELGVADWTPYPDGGGYRLQADGSVLITFTVLPELKGHSITLRPARAADGKAVNWKCSADAGLNSGFLPANCR